MMDVIEVDRLMAACFDDETGELIDDERYEDLKTIRLGIIEDKLLKVKRLRNDIVGYKAAKTAYENKIKKAYADIECINIELMIELDDDGLKTDKVKAYFKKSKSVVVDDVYKLPEAFIRYKAPEPNKEALKTAMKDGAIFDGVRIVEKTNLVIK